MAERPPVPRDEKGRLVGGRGALNPGGEPKWVNAVKTALQSSAAHGAALLHAVIRGEPQKMTIQGEQVEVTPSIENRLKAVEIALRYTVPAPKAEVSVVLANARPPWLDELSPDLKLAIAKAPIAEADEE